MEHSARVTQRAPQVCYRCATKKMRCSKTVPCDACIKQGLAEQCHRESVIVKNRSHPVKVRSQKRKRDENEDVSEHVHQPPGNSLAHSAAEQQATAVALIDMSQRTSYQGTPVDVTPDRSSNAPLEEEGDPTISSQLATDQSWVTFPNLEMSPSSSQQEDASPLDSTLTSLEVLVWGRQSNTGRPPANQHMVSLHSGVQGDPLSSQQAIQVLKFHWKWLAWTHNIINWTQFREECQTYWNEGMVKEKAWIALYYAVLCVSKRSHMN